MARRKAKKGRGGMQSATVCISTTLVLILLGLMVFSILTARNLSAYVKENLTVTVMLADTISQENVDAFITLLDGKAYTHATEYISKDDALREQSEALGSDPSEFLGFNPFVATVELRLDAGYANRDSLAWIAEELCDNSNVTDIAYQEDLMDSVNDNLRKASLVLLILAVLMTCVSFSLINNTVRLSVYSKRFLIYTMKLVGAPWAFIRGPFIARSVKMGLLAATIACAVLACGVYALYSYEPSIVNIVTRTELTVTAVAVYLFGIVITVFCSHVSVNKFLKMRAEELYNI